MKKWVVALIIGLGMLAFGSGVGVNDSTIKCGSEIMGPGDTCEETRGGVTTDTKTYNEMKADKEAGQRTFNSWGRWVLLGGGAVLTVLGIGGIVATRRKRAAAGPAVTGTPPGGYPPVPGGQLNQSAPPGPGVAGSPQHGFPPHGPAQPQPGRLPQGPAGPAGSPSGGFPQQGPGAGRPGPAPHGYPRQQPPGQPAPGQPARGYPPPAPQSQPYPHDFGPGASNPE